MTPETSMELSRRELSGATVALSLGLLPHSDGQDSNTAVWPTVQSNAAHTGYCDSYQESTIVGGGGGIVWQVDVGGKLEGSPVVANGAVIIGTKDGRVAAFELRDGTHRWTREGTDEIRRAVTVNSNTVFANLDRQAITALDIRTGKTKWRSNLETRMYRNGGPVCAGEILYTCDMAGFVYAFDAQSGERKWRTELRSTAPAGTLAVKNDRVVVANSWLIEVLDANTGDEVWTKRTGALVWGPPTISDDIYLPIGSDPSQVVALSKESGDIQWVITISEVPATSGATTLRPRSPIVTDKSVICVDTGGTVVAAERSDGSEQWRHTIEASPFYHPVADRDSIYIPTKDGLASLLTSSGRIDWHTLEGKVPTSPALVGDRVIVSTTGGKLIALGTEQNALDRWGTQIGLGLAGLGGYGAYRYLRDRRTTDQE